MTLTEISFAYLESLEIPVGTPQALSRMSGGFSNDNYLLTTSLGRYRLRVPQFSIQADQLLAEQMVLKWASEKSNIVVPLLHHFTLPKGTHLSIFPFIDADLNFDLHNEQLMRSAGMALAEFHLAVEGYTGKLPMKPLSRSFSLHAVDIEDLRTILNEETVSEYPGIWDAVENLLSRMQKISKQMTEEPYISLPHLSCHGDYAPANLLAHQDSVAGIIDFECCRWAPRVYDLATFLLALQQGEGYEEFMSAWFLKGYKSMITLSDTELGWIPRLQMIRSLDAANRHFKQAIQGDYQVHAGLVMYWDRITSVGQN
ncbi:phosphotransferase enzyme family protein [Paenibacillus solisilvae]|uniref:Phosphotransferase enzyme family protein n=1 Tax=Paenibacillus solisilvae TaxID=2486751 RepID=A0ABW0W0F6_9BACL